MVYIVDVKVQVKKMAFDLTHKCIIVRHLQLPVEVYTLRSVLSNVVQQHHFIIFRVPFCSQHLAFWAPSVRHPLSSSTNTQALSAWFFVTFHLLIHKFALFLSSPDHFMMLVRLIWVPESPISTIHWCWWRMLYDNQNLKGFSCNYTIWCTAHTKFHGLMQLVNLLDSWVSACSEWEEVSFWLLITSSHSYNSSYGVLVS